MSNLKFRQLLILSNSSKSANQFKFSETLNLITGKDNSVGKSTLVKLLFWSVGCEPSLDEAWKSLDCETLVEFSIDNKIYKIKRYKDIISIKENNLSFVEYTKISGEYSKKMSEIVGFKALLPKRNTDQLEIPPPAFYFLPFYIDQKRSWSKAWDNFENLAQYNNWTSTIIKYHVGMLTPEYFDLEIEKAQKKDIQKLILSKIEKIDTALEVVESIIPKSTIVSISKEKFESLTNEIKVDLAELQMKQERYLDTLTQLHGEKVYLEQQKVLTQKIIAELDKDYRFSIENIVGDEIECPLCGVIHENSIVNRTSIMTDKFQAENQLNTINSELYALDEGLNKSSVEFELNRNLIQQINDKYLVENQNQSVDIVKIIESIAANSLMNNVNNDKRVKLGEVDTLIKELKELTKKQKKLNTKERKEEINSSFSSIFYEYITLLDAKEVNISAINSPLDYNKIIKEGGAATGTRSILAYYLTIFTMVEKYDSEVKTALVIDTPNQQEQSERNYDKIVDILTNKISSNSQIILCAMENEHLAPYKIKAHTITLNHSKLLDTDKYEEVYALFE